MSARILISLTPTGGLTRDSSSNDALGTDLSSMTQNSPIDNDTQGNDIQSYANRVARTMASSVHDAEDASQDVLLALLRKPGRLRGNAHAYLYAAIRNRLRSGHRRNAIRERGVPPTCATPDDPCPPSFGEREDVEILTNAIGRLSPKYRMVVYLRYFAGLGLLEISELVGAHRSTVKTRLKRALRQLRKRVDRTQGGTHVWRSLVAPLLHGSSTHNSTPAARTARSGSLSNLRTPMRPPIAKIATGLGVLGLAIGVIPLTSKWGDAKDAETRFDATTDKSSNGSSPSPGLLRGSKQATGNNPLYARRTEALPSDRDQSSASNNKSSKSRPFRIRGEIPQWAAERDDGLTIHVYHAFDRERTSRRVSPHVPQILAASAVKVDGSFAVDLDREFDDAIRDVANRDNEPTQVLVVLCDTLGPIVGAAVNVGLSRDDDQHQPESLEHPVRFPEREPVLVTCSVVDDQGQPIAGATCVLCDNTPFLHPDGTMVKAKTNVDGIATIRVASFKDFYPLSNEGHKHWHVYAEGFAQARSGEFSLDPDDDALKDEATVVRLIRSISPLHLQFIDDRREAIVNRSVDVSVIGKNGPPRTLGALRGMPLVLDVAGRLTLKGLDPAMSGLEFHVPGHQFFAFAMDELVNNPTVTLLRNPGALNVRAPEGCELVRIELYDDSNRKRLGWIESGGIEVVGLTPEWSGEFTLKAWLKSETEAIEARIMLRPGEDVNVSLTR